MGIKKEFLKDTVVYGLGSGLKKFIGLLLLPFYTRALTIEEFGIIETLSTFVMLATAFYGLGLDAAGGYYFFKAGKQKGDVIYTIFIIRLLTFIPSIIPLFFCSQISVLLFDSPQYAWAVGFSLILIPISILMEEQGRLFRYYRQPWLFSLSTIIKSVSNVALGIWLVVILKQGVDGSMIARIVSSVVVIVVTWLFFNKDKYSYHFSKTWARTMLKFGFPFVWSAMSVWILQVSDRFFLLRYSTLEEIGKYSIGSTFSQPVMLLNMAVQMSFSVLFFSVYHKETDAGKPNSRKMAIDIFNIYLVLSVFVSVFVSVFSIEAVGIITTEAYVPGAVAIPFLAFSLIAEQSYQTMAPGIVLSEKTWHFSWITGLAASINIGLNFYAIPKWGFLGASVTTFISFVIYWVVKVIVANRYFTINYPYYRIGIYYLMMFFLSLIPSVFWYFNLGHVSYTIKIGIVLLSIAMPLVLNLIKFSRVKEIVVQMLSKI